MSRRSDDTPAFEAHAFTVPRRLALARIIEAAAGKIEVSASAGQPAHVQYLDTFDRRLRRAGVVLEHVAFAGGGGLRYRELGRAAVRIEAPGAAPPAFARDVSHLRLHSLLSPLIDARRLLVVARTRGRLTVARGRNREGKVVLVMEYFIVRRGPARLTVCPLRGYERFARRVVRRLGEVEGIAPDRREPMLVAPEGPGAAFGGTVIPDRVALDPGERSDAACKRLLATLDAVMEMNAPAIEADLDPECLHDFRVAVRKARSLLGKMKGVFAPGVTRRLRSDLGWLGERTGPVRDLDIHLQEPGLQEFGPAALRAFLEAARKREHRALCRALRSARGRRIRSTFRSFIERAPPAQPRAGNALTPVAALSAVHILKAWRRIVAEGRAIGDDSPADSFHELRKSCKSLRYLLELFRAVHCAKPVGRTIARLKRLQDNLGAYQDLQVRRAMLRRFREQERASLDAAGLGAIDTLCAALTEREREIRAEFATRFGRYDSKRVHVKFEAALKRNLQ